MNISISKSEVINEVDRRASLEGYVSSDRYDAIYPNKSRRELLDGFWIEGCTSVVSLFKRYLSGSTINHSLTSYNNNETFSLSVEMPDRYDVNLDGSVATSIKMMIATNILNGWMGIVAPELSPKYEAESAGYADLIKQNILYRVNPDSSFVDASDDSDAISKTEEELSAAGLDEDSLLKTEEDLKSANKDTDKIREVESLIYYAKCDYEELVQEWGKCSNRQ